MILKISEHWLPVMAAIGKGAIDAKAIRISVYGLDSDRTELHKVNGILLGLRKSRLVNFSRTSAGGSPINYTLTSEAIDCVDRWEKLDDKSEMYGNRIVRSKDETETLNTRDLLNRAFNRAASA